MVGSLVRRARVGTATLAVIGLCLAGACTPEESATVTTATTLAGGGPPDSVSTTVPSPTAPPTTVETTTTLPPVPDRTPPWMGATVPRGDAAAIHAWEEDLGVRFDLIRRFARWDDPQADSGFVELLETGHRIHLSIRPVTRQGTVIAWRELADAQPGEPRYGQLVGWVDRVVALGPDVFVTINHEPETLDSAPNGSAEDYVALWRRFAELVRERGGEEQVLVWTLTGGAFTDGRAELWYPGDDVVDVVGADLYNWHTCQGTDRSWTSMAELLAAPLAFAEAHDKPLAVPEFASVEDAMDPGRKAGWMDAATNALTDPDVADRLLYVAWFDITAPGGTWPDCVWDHDTSPAAERAFERMIARLTGENVNDGS